MKVRIIKKIKKPWASYAPKAKKLSQWLT